MVDGAVCREEVEIMFALRIPDAAATRSGKHDRQRVVVVSCKVGLGLDGRL